MRMFFGLRCQMVCVASTWPSSPPMPNASAPSAPWVEVCESPHSMITPGLGDALLGPDHVQDALARIAEPEIA